MLSHITSHIFIKQLSNWALPSRNPDKIMWKNFSIVKGFDKKKSRPGPEAAHVGVVLITRQ